jgi:PAS domain S-box-containing protein
MVIKETFLSRTFLWRRYGIVPLSVLTACALTQALQAVSPHRSLSLVFFFAAVAVSAGSGGLYPGVLATLLSALTCDYFFLLPLHSLAIARDDVPLLILFLLGSLLMNGLGERLRLGTRAADQRFHDLVQGLDGIAWEVNPKTSRFTFVSQRAEVILGYPIAKWLETPDFRVSILHPEDKAATIALYRDAITHGGDHACEYRVFAADGREIWLRETVHAVLHENGSAARLTGLCVDITQRKQAVQELSTVKDELAALHGIATALSASLEISAVYTNLKQQLSEHLDISAGAIYLATEAGDHLHLQEYWGMPKEHVQEWATLPPSASSGEGTEVSVPDNSVSFPVDAALSVASSPERMLSTWQESVMVPLLVNGELFGGLCLCSQTSNAFQPYRTPFFAALGRQVGMVLENARLYEQVRAGREHLQRLSCQLVQVQEAERRQIARELHDEIGQMLTGLKLNLEMDARLRSDTERINLQEALSLINDLIIHVRELSLNLRPAMLDDLGLLSTLLWHFERFSGLTHVKVVFEHTRLERRFSYEVETTAYRIVQEALTNVARHAGVDEVTVRLWATSESLGIQVIDQGRGFSSDTAHNGFSTGGLAGMTERVTLLGGHLDIESTSQGTGLTAELPLNCSGREIQGREM